MSVFTSRVTDTVEIPHDPGQSVTFRKLAPKHLRAAREAAQAAVFEEAKRSMELAQVFSGDVIKALTERKDGEKDGDEKPASKTAQDPLLLYDAAVLCESGIKSWTYQEKPTRATIEDLDEPTVEHIARAILKLSKPELFQSDDEQEAAQKNG